ncbi:MAG: hypothetical protein BM560_05495 [Roseobacter sp. MedPE-SWde]|nr:MAG: hypothetical protein BM560_05495 [Roseobacter sp. MedPE-SWde]
MLPFKAPQRCVELFSKVVWLVVEAAISMLPVAPNPGFGCNANVVMLWRQKPSKDSLRDAQSINVGCVEVLAP